MTGQARWWEGKSDLLAAGALFGAPFVFFYPLTLGAGIFASGDFLIFYYPIRVALARAFVEGRLPLWVPGIAAGFPLFAEGQIAALYPVNQLLYRILPIQFALTYEVLLHLGWLMAGMYVFARALRLAIPAALFAALAFAGSAFMMENLLITNMLATIAHLPWMLWLLEKILTARRKPARAAWFVLLCILVAFQFLSLHAQYAFLDLAILALYAATWWWQQSDTTHANRPATWRARIGQPLGVVALAALVAALLAAVQLLPTLELARLSNRAAGITYEDFTNQSVELRHLALFVAPFALGGPDAVPGGVVGYLGIVPLCLALAAPALKRNRRTLFWLALALAGLALAFGQNNPIFPLLYRVPVFNLLRISGRFLYVVSFAAALLGAIAFDHTRSVRAAPKAGFTRAAQIAALIVAAFIGIEIVLVYRVPLSGWLAVWAWLPIPLAVGGVGVVAAAARGMLTRSAASVGLIGLTILDLTAFAAVPLQSQSALVAAQDFFAAPRALSALDPRPGASRVLTAGALIPPFSAVKENLYPDLNLLYGIDSAKGSTGISVQRARDFTDSFSPGMLNLLAVRYLLIPIFPPDETGRIVSQPSDKFALRLGKEKIDLPPTPAAVIQVDSYLENGNAAEGTPAGRIVFSFDDGTTVELALRAGIETADWAIERAPGRRAPPIARTFSAFAGARFQGHTYRARLALPQTRVVTALQVVAASDSLRIEHIRLIDDRGGDTLVDYFVGASDHSVVFRSDQTTVIENADALPRAFLIHAAEILDDAATLARLRAYTFDPRQVVLLADGDARADASPEQADDESVEIVAYQPEHVELAVTAKRQGYVILSDTWYPGWTAWLDGKPTALYRADYTFRAVKVDAGTHKIEFDYAPMSFYLGAAISVTTLMVLVLGATWMKRKS